MAGEQKITVNMYSVTVGFQTAAGRLLGRFQRDFPAQGVGRFLVQTEAIDPAHTHSWIQ